ncbi:MAG: Maf-like protein, partial [Oligoflexales bacterium]|nr:Maf-like protein [Oligoflexales bacterium]
MNSNSYEVILASTSPRRRDLLGSLGIRFTSKSPGFEEKLRKDEDAAKYVLRNGEGKSTWVAGEISSGVIKVSPEKKSVVLGADTVVVLNGEILQKPKSTDEDIDMLRQLSGRTHQVLTGFALSFQKKPLGEFFQQSHVVSTDVSFKDLSIGDRDNKTIIKNGTLINCFPFKLEI